MAGAPRSGLLVVLACTGCPFVFGPPDVSKVDGTVPNTDDTDTEETTPTVDTSDTGTVAPFDLPTVVDLQVRRFVDKIGFAFSVVDTDQDFVNGRIEITSDVEGAEPLIYTIPGDLDTWEPLGRSVITVPQGWLGCDGLTESWSVTMTDAAAHVGPTVTADVVIDGLGLIDEGTLFDFGWLSAPTVACVEFNADPQNPEPIQSQLQLDREDLRFVAVTSGTHTFELAWQNVMDADLLLKFQPQGAVLAPPIVQIGPAFEQFTYDLVADTTYVLSPTYFFLQGNEPPYVATVLMAPPIE